MIWIIYDLLYTTCYIRPDDNDVAYDFRNKENVTHLAFALKNLGNRYFQIAFQSGMSCLLIFGK